MQPEGRRIIQCEVCTATISTEDERPSDRELARYGWMCDEYGNYYCEEHSWECEECGRRFNDEEPYAIEEVPICDSCSRAYYRTCALCGGRHHIGRVRQAVNEGTTNSAVVCNDCAERLIYQPNLSTLIAESNLNMPTDGHTFQPSFRLKGFQPCPECKESNGELCSRCLEEKKKIKEEEETNLWIFDTRVRSYHEYDHEKFKNQKLRQPDEHPFLYYGVELELLFDSRADINTISKTFIEATGGIFVAEMDRSVTNLGNGCEFISRPMSYKVWQSKEIQDRLKAGFMAIDQYNPIIPQPEGCGLHIHMSRIFFEHNTEKEMEKIRSDIDWIFQVYQPEMEAISDRKYTLYCASKAYRIKEQLRNNPATTYLKGKLNLKREIAVNKSDTLSREHHDCIVLTNRTIEVRTFRSTVDPNKILAYIELCRSVAHAARNIELNDDNTLSSIIFCKDAPHLVELVNKTKIDLDKKFNADVEVEL